MKRFIGKIINKYKMKKAIKAFKKILYEDIHFTLKELESIQKSDNPFNVDELRDLLDEELERSVDDMDTDVVDFLVDELERIMKNKTCCFSGHRDIPYDKKADIYNNLVYQIQELIHEGYDTFICGGALGFDTLCANAVLEIKHNFENINLVLALPCENQTNNWQQKDIDIYNSIIEKSDKVIYTSSQYYNGCMHKRNRYMVDNSSYCIYYLNKNFGGTAYTVKYASQKGLKLKNMALSEK